MNLATLRYRLNRFAGERFLDDTRPEWLWAKLFWLTHVPPWEGEERDREFPLP